MKELLELQAYLATLEKKLSEQEESIQSSEKDRDAYFQTRKQYLDLKNALDTSFKKGKEKGEKKGIAKNLKEKGVSLQDIIKATGLTQEEIEGL